MIKHFARLAAAFALLLCTLPALAQERPFICQDTTDHLDCAAIADAAQPLLRREASVAVYMVAQGDASGADFLDHLAADKLASNGSVDNRLVAVYVSLAPRYAELRGGDQWNAALLPNDTITAIRTTKLAPALAAGKYTPAYVDTLAAIEAAIAGSASAPSSTRSEQPAVTRQADPTGNSPIASLAWAGLGIVALTGGGYGAFRWRKARQAVAEARWYQTTAQQAVVAAIAELQRALAADRGLATADQAAYSAADAQQIAKTQQTVDEQLAPLQARSTALATRIDGTNKPAADDYATVAAEYKQIEAQIAHLHVQLAATGQLRQELDAQARQAPGAIAQARQQLVDAAALLEPLAGVVPDATVLLAPLRDQIAQVEAAHAAHDSRGAIALAQATGTLFASLNSMVQAYHATRDQFDQLRNEATVIARQGYHVAGCQAALTAAETALATAVAAMNHAGAAAAKARLAAVAPLLAQAATSGRGMLALRAENDQQLLALGVRANHVGALVARARATFDIVDEFAESTWSDIRGNGSEAEASAGAAATLWQRAAANNTLEQQQFASAQADLATVDSCLARATTLCDAIIARLRDLEHARTIATATLASTASDVAAGKAYLDTNTADVGVEPETRLAKAAEVLAQAEAEAAQQKPDWLALVRLAQAADSEADAALAGARSEVEVMNRLRNELQNAHQVASSEIQRAARFCDLHRGDIGISTRDSLHALQAQLEAAGAGIHQAEARVEDERRSALTHMRDQVVNIQVAAGRLYSAMYSDFQRAESARAAAAAEAAAAEEQRRRRSSSSHHSFSSSGSSSSSSSGSSGGSWGGGSSSGGSW